MSDIAANRASTRAAARTILATGVDWGLLIVRLVLGIVFVMHGWPKVIGWSHTMAMMTHTGIPAPFVALDIITEFFGGLALIFGVLARLASAGLIVVMLVAIFKVHLANGFFMNWYGNQKGEGIEYHLLVIAMALLVILAGPGRLAFADWERRWVTKTT
jgi:putative oxidoreductase